MIVIILAATALFLYALKMPSYTNLAAKKALDDKTQLYQIRDQNFHENYYRKINELKTCRNTYMDWGSGIAIASSTLLAILLYKKPKTFESLKLIKTPSKRWIFALSNVFWLLTIPGTMWYYTFRAERGDYPWFADSIAIPIFYQIIATSISLIFVNLFIWATSYNGIFPSALLLLISLKDKKMIAWDVFWAFWLLVSLWLLANSIIDGDHIAIPINLFFTYILLSLRAGKINYYKININYANRTNK